MISILKSFLYSDFDSKSD